MRSYIIPFLVGLSFLLVIGFLCTSLNKESGDRFKATISKEATPTIHWVKGITEHTWSLERSIPILLENGKMVIGYMYDNAPFVGGYLIHYKDTYPPAINKEIVVSGHYRNGKYWIDTEARVK